MKPNAGPARFTASRPSTWLSCLCWLSCLWACPWITLVLATPAPAQGQDAPDAGDEAAAPGENEPVGTWKFRTDRPVKVIVVGGSVAAYFGGNFGEFLEGACSAVEVHNVARARYGAWAMHKRMIAQVFRNRRVDPAAGGEFWIAVNGGLNSVGTPEKTNEWIRRIIVDAHAQGYKLLGLSLTPWGDQSDTRRWTGANGLRYRRATQKAVDFVMGRLDPDAALGSYGSERAKGAWLPEERIDIAVDLYDSALRDREAALYDAVKLERALRKDRQLIKEVEALPEDQREGAWASLTAAAAEVPRWFLRKELRAFDHVHPNREGHRAIAQAACAKLPASWQCQCESLATLDPKLAPKSD